MPKTEQVQLRIRIPKPLHDEIEREAIALGSTVQRELLMRVMRGKAGAGVPTDANAARAYAQVKGELDVAQKLISSLDAVVTSMANQASAYTPAVEHEDLDLEGEEESSK